MRSKSEGQSAKIELVSRWTDAAFREVYSRYIKPLHSYILRRVRNHHDAEDLTSHVFMQALKHLDPVDPDSPKLAAWLYTTARNASANHSRDTRRFVATLSIEELPNVPSESDPGESYLTDEKLNEVLDALSRLPEEGRKALLLRLVEQMSHSEIARALGRSESSARVMTHRALASVKRKVS